MGPPGPICINNGEFGPPIHKLVDGKEERLCVFSQIKSVLQWNGPQFSLLTVDAAMLWQWVLVWRLRIYGPCSPVQGPARDRYLTLFPLWGRPVHFILSTHATLSREHNIHVTVRGRRL